jgi:predicted ArsR family transcriptional regulator
MARSVGLRRVELIRRRRLLSLRSANLTVDEIAQAMSIHPSEVRRCLRQAGVRAGVHVEDNDSMKGA